MELARMNDNGLLDVVFCTTKEGLRMTELRNAGYLDFVASEQPKCESGYVAVDSFKIEGGKIVQSWIIKQDPDVINEQITDLKQQLSDSDYKITKCYECSLVGEVLPYDIEALHQERQSIRDEINRLEALL